MKLQRRTAPSLLRIEALDDRIVPSVLFVDDDAAQIPDAQYATIQEAVDAAKEGDKIYVGDYIINVDAPPEEYAEDGGGGEEEQYEQEEEQYEEEEAPPEEPANKSMPASLAAAASGPSRVPVASWRWRSSMISR